MTQETATHSPVVAHPKRVRDLSDAQHNAVLLFGLLEGTFYLDNEGQGNAMTASLEVAMHMAERLADELETLGSAKHA